MNNTSWSRRRIQERLFSADGIWRAVNQPTPHTFCWHRSFNGKVVVWHWVPAPFADFVVVMCAIRLTYLDLYILGNETVTYRDCALATKPGLQSVKTTNARAGAIQNSDQWASTDAFFLGSRHWFPVEESFQLRIVINFPILFVLRSRLTTVDNRWRENITVWENDGS